MGLSKRNRVRTTAAKIGPAPLILTYDRTLGPVLEQAVRAGLWLEGMQKHLETTAQALKDRPAAALAHFQKTLGRPSYFSTSTHSGNWVVLLGPRPGAVVESVRPSPIAVPVQEPLFQGLLESVAAFGVACTRFCKASMRSLHQWLMHPLLDTREPS